MSLLVGIIVAIVVIGLTVLFIIRVLNSENGGKSQSLGSRLWAYNESDIRGNQLDRMRNMDDYYKHTNIKPNSMLIFAAAFICISVLFLIAISVFAGMPVQRKPVSYHNEKLDDEEKAYIKHIQDIYHSKQKPSVFPKSKINNEITDSDTSQPQTSKADISEKEMDVPSEEMVFGVKDGNHFEVGLAGFEIDVPEEWTVSTDEQTKELINEAKDSLSSDKELSYKVEKSGINCLYSAGSDNSYDNINVCEGYLGKEYGEIMKEKPYCYELYCYTQVDSTIQALQTLGAENIHVYMDYTQFMGELWPALIESYRLDNKEYGIAMVPIAKDEYLYLITVLSDSEDNARKILSEYVSAIK